MGLSHDAASAAQRNACKALQANLPRKVEGGTTVTCLGSLERGLKKGHAYKFLFPVGFTSFRTYPDVLSSTTSKTAVYDCRIDASNDGEGTVFHVTRRDGGWAAEGKTAGACWIAAHSALKMQGRAEEAGPQAPDGPMFFGFGVKEVQLALEGLPGAAKCSRYYFWAQRDKGAQFPMQRALRPGAAQAAEGAAAAAAAAGETTEGGAARKRAREEEGART